MNRKCTLQHSDNPAPTKPTGIDPRNLRQEDLVKIVEQNEMLHAEQKSKLLQMLVRYLPSLTDKPGKCKLLKY
jgi:hypothetical protein